MNKSNDISEDAYKEMQQENNLHSDNQMTPEDAFSYMQSENNKAELEPNHKELVTKKQVNGILKLIYQTELLLGDFFKKLKEVDEKFNTCAQYCFGKADKIMSSIKNPSEEEKKLAIAYTAAALTVKGIGSLWQAVQTEQQLRGIIKIFASEAPDKLPYIGMLIDMADMGSDVAFTMLLNSTSIDSVLENLEVYRSLDYTFRLANYLYAVYDASLNGSFTELPYPTMFDVNKALLANLAHIDKKDTEELQLTSNRVELTKVAERISSVMNGDQKLPELLDVLLASDEQLTAAAISMGLPGPEMFKEEENDSEESRHFPFENLNQCPESLDYVSSFSYLLSCGDSHAISEKIKSNGTLKSIADYIEEFKKNQSQFDSRERLYAINAYLLGAVFFLFFWHVFEWKWYWSLIVGVVMSIIGFKVAPYSDLGQNCRHKAILLERELYKNTKFQGGFTDVINFHEIRRKNNYVFAGALIGGIIGIFGGPLTFIGGCVLGAFIGHLIKSHKTEDENWRNISIGSGWKAKLCCGILSISFLLLLLGWIFGYQSPNFKSKSTGNSAENNRVVDNGYVSSTNNHQSDEAISASILSEDTVVKDNSIESEIEKTLYNIYSSPNMDETFPDGTPLFSDNFKKKVKGLGTIENIMPYTNSFMSLQEKATEDFILDYDLLVNAQEDPINMDLEIKNIKVIDNDNVEVSAIYINNNRKYNRIYVMKRENGTFKIDDFIDDGESVRNWINSEIKLIEANQNSAQTDTLISFLWEY